MNDPYETLHDLLSDMQIELGRRAWTENVFERIEQACDFRGKMFAAIQDYAEHCVKRGY